MNFLFLCFSLFIVFSRNRLTYPTHDSFITQQSFDYMIQHDKKSNTMPNTTILSTRRGANCHHFHAPRAAIHNTNVTKNRALSLLYHQSILGGIGTVLTWWPIKAYRPCPNFIERGGRYVRSGQGLDEIAFGRDSTFQNDN
mmetsp:Transcript_1205/g.2235  ORF Transcript_1205/g.2235 Transcript_1205/m.2235 type:complete len:141 (+) Transcript_1205:448-870(+)